MDRRERSGDANTALLAAMAGHQSGIWTAIPCTVASDLAPGQRTISCQPAIKSRVQRPDGSFTWVQLPLLVDVVVHFPEGGGVTMTFPVKAGDECLVVLASRCIDDWWANGGVQEQPDLRMHDLSDGFAFVGVSSVPRVIPNISTTRAQFRSNDGQAFVELDPGTHLIRARTTGKFTVDADDDVLIKSGTRIDLQAPTVQTTASALAGTTAPQITLFGNMSWFGTGGAAGTVGISNMTVTWANSALNLNNTNFTANGGAITHNTKNIGSTHTHSGGSIGAGNTGVPN